jgi:hypothetical protein
MAAGPTAQPHDPIAALNQVLSEVIDMLLELKQAHQKVPRSHALYVEIDRLSDDLKVWAGLLLDEDRALGVSALASMPSVAGRVSPTLWPGTVSDDEVGAVVRAHVDRLLLHVHAALAEQEDAEARAILTEVDSGLSAHQEALNQFSQA